MRLNKYAFLLLILVANLVAQRHKYPKGYFMMPIKPNQTNTLSGSFGDLRTNHFHAGLDIRTDQIQGLPVYAAADGYVSRIKISPGGYGNALYIQHPNGYTTLYGHLRTYVPKIGTIAKERQYQDESFEIDITLSANQVPIRKGELVAFSGNSGASGGPHLHFEIRDQEENAINPHFFGFSEITDNVPPVFERLIVRPLSADALVNGSPYAQSFNVLSSGYGQYYLLNSIYIKGQVGFEMLAHDKMSGSPFKYGISQSLLDIDGATQFWFNLEKTAFDQARDINAHIDYALAETNGTKIQKLYKLPGNRIEAYSTNHIGGAVELYDDQPHKLFITIKDPADQISSLSGTLIRGLPFSEPNKASAPSSTPSLTYSIDKTRLVIAAKNYDGDQINVEKGSRSVSINKLNSLSGTSFFVYDLKEGIAQSINAGSVRIPLNIDAILPLNGGTYSENGVHVQVGTDLFEPLPLMVENLGGVLKINSEKIPLRSPIRVNWQPFGISYSHAGVYQTDDGLKFIEKLNEGSVNFTTRELGTFKILNDFDPPTISPIKIDTNSLSFRISDKLSGVKSYRCEVDGDWVLMNYDAKSQHLWSEKYEDTDLFEGYLKLTVTDFQGNVATFERDIYEYMELKAEEKKRKAATIKKKRRKPTKRKR